MYRAAYRMRYPVWQSPQAPLARAGEAPAEACDQAAADAPALPCGESARAHAQGLAAHGANSANTANTANRPGSAAKVIDLSRAGKGNYVAQRGFLIELLWFLLEACVINNKLLPFSAPRVWLLRRFGARIGANCRMVHPLRVKAPWNLEVGDNCWFGVDVWLYNQASIRIGSNVCISQGTFLSAGSHDLSETMDLRVAPIVIEDGVWITSKCVVQMGVVIGRSAVVTPLSVVHRSLAPAGVYGGNPVRLIRPRFPA